MANTLERQMPIKEFSFSLPPIIHPTPSIPPPCIPLWEHMGEGNLLSDGCSPHLCRFTTIDSATLLIMLSIGFKIPYWILSPGGTFNLAHHADGLALNLEILTALTTADFQARPCEIITLCNVVLENYMVV